MANCIDKKDNTNGIDIEEVDTTGDSRCRGDGGSSLAMRCTDEMSGNSDALRRLDGCLKTGHDIQKYDGITVCVNCGQVFRDSGDLLRADPTQTYACNHDPDGKKAYIRGIHGSKDTFATAKRFNTAVLDTLVSSLSLGKHIQDLAVEKYKTLIATHFRCATLTTKRVLSAICLYITLISEGNIVTIGHICNAVNCTPYEFNRVYNQVIKEFPDFRPEQMPIESLVPVVLSEANIDKTERKVGVLGFNVFRIHFIDSMFCVWLLGSGGEGGEDLGVGEGVLADRGPDAHSHHIRGHIPGLEVH
jgi:hypothetical protein